MPINLLKTPPPSPEPKNLLPPKPAPAPRQPGFLEKAGRSLIDVGQGAAKNITSDAFQLGSMVLKQATAPIQGVRVPGLGGATVGDITKVPDKISADLKLKNISQGVGAGIADVAKLALPTEAVTGAKAVMEALPFASYLEKVPLAGKTLGYVTQKVLNSIPEAAVGVGYGKLKGQSDKEALSTGGVFGVFSGLGEVVGDSWRAFKGTLPDNITKALGGIKGKGMQEVLSKTSKAIDAFKTMAKMASDIVVKDADGVEKPFVPTKATYSETLQAFKQTKDSIYSAYTDLLKKAGDKGTTFTKDNWQTVVDAIKSESKDATGTFKNKAASLVKDLEENFGVLVDQAGKVTSAADADLLRIQNFIEKVNTDVNPLSDKAGAQVSSAASRSIRAELDGKIESAKGGQYQKLRDAYANMKAIENDLVNQFKKASTKSGSKIAGYIQGYGDVDLVVSLLTANPAEAVRGIGLNVLGGVMKYLKDPEVNLQRAFQMLEDTEGPSALKTRMFGGAEPNAQVEGDLKKAAGTMKGPFNKGGTPSTIADAFDDYKYTSDYVKLQKALEGNPQEARIIAEKSQKFLKDRGIKSLWRGGTGDGVSYSYTQSGARRFVSADTPGTITEIKITPEILSRIQIVEGIIGSGSRNSLDEYEVILKPIEGKIKP